MPTEVTEYDGGQRERQIVGSMPDDPRKRLTFLSRMAQGESLSGDEAIGVEIEVREWIAQPIELANEHTGEYEDRLRLVLSDGDGIQLSTCSPSAMQAWRLVVQALGNGPFNPPVKCVLRKGKSRKGLAFTTIVVLE